MNRQSKRRERGLRLVFLCSAMLVGVVVAGPAGCSSSSGTGGLRQACYMNGTCNAGLQCISQVCVSLPDGGTGGSGSGTAGAGGRGTGGSAGAAGGTGGTAGVAGATGGAGGGAAGSAGATGGTGGGASGAPIAGLTLWLDADRGVATSGPTVTLWEDQSAAAENATAVAATGPTLVSNAVSGHAAIHFTNSSLMNVVGSGTGWGTGSFLLELVVRDTMAGGSLWSQSDTSGNSLLLSTSFTLSASGPNLIGSASASTTADLSDNSLHSVGVWRDGNNFSLLLDGAVVGTPQALATFDATSGSASLGSFTGDLLEVVGKNAAVSTADVAAIESYFHAKYGTP